MLHQPKIVNEQDKKTIFILMGSFRDPECISFIFDIRVKFTA